MSLAGKNVLITGASMGIGAAIARRLAKQKANLILLARNEKKLQELARELQVDSGRLVYCTADVSRYDQVEDAVRKAVKEVGDIDILVNNAGLALGAPEIFPDLKIDDIVTMTGTNINGYMFAAYAVLNAGGMKKRKRGTILNVTSVTGLEVPPFPGEAVYHASKAAQEAFTNVLRAELQETNIKVLALRPGIVATHFHRQRVGGDRKLYDEFMEGMEPLLDDDVAESAAFMISSEERVSVTSISVTPTAQRTLQVIDRTWNARNQQSGSGSQQNSSQQGNSQQGNSQQNNSQQNSSQQGNSQQGQKKSQQNNSQQGSSQQSQNKSQQGNSQQNNSQQSQNSSQQGNSQQGNQGGQSDSRDSSNNNESNSQGNQHSNDRRGSGQARGQESQKDQSQHDDQRGNDSSSNNNNNNSHGASSGNNQSSGSSGSSNNSNSSANQNSTTNKNDNDSSKNQNSGSNKNDSNNSSNSQNNSNNGSSNSNSTNTSSGDQGNSSSNNKGGGNNSGGSNSGGGNNNNHGSSSGNNQSSGTSGSSNSGNANNSGGGSGGDNDKDRMPGSY